jgi:CheY-like chemotaxis protein
MGRSYALVIDDNREMADSVCQMLALLNIESRVAYGPRTAITTMAEEVPEMVFLDINMPGVSGFEVLGYLRREPGMTEVPVIVISSDNQPETIDEAQKMGVVAFISKPFGLEEIKTVLEQQALS